MYDSEDRCVYDLRAVDVLRERLDASYTEAKTALDATDGDVVSALAFIEQRRSQDQDSLQGFIGDVIEDVRGVLEGKGVTSATVSLRGQTLFTTSLALTGAAGAAMVVLGAILSHCRLEVATGQREDGDA